MLSLSRTPPVYIHKEHQNTSNSAVSELMRFIHHIITYVVPAKPRAINWARPLTQNHQSWVRPGQWSYQSSHTHWGTSTWKNNRSGGARVRKIFDCTILSKVTKILLVKDHACNGKELFCLNHLEYLCHFGFNWREEDDDEQKKSKNTVWPTFLSHCSCVP